MKRAGLFLLLFVVALSLLLLMVAWYLSSYQSSNASTAGMMGQMMGNQYVSGMTAPMPLYVWAAVATLFVLIAGGVVGLAYYLAFPEIKTSATSVESPQKMRSETDYPKEDWSVLLRTSKPEERKVLEVIASHDGKYLQKFVVKESGLSRLKTHRIVSRFAERGVITVAKSGNTNELSLAPWLRQDAPQTNG